MSTQFRTRKATSATALAMLALACLAPSCVDAPPAGTAEVAPLERFQGAITVAHEAVLRFQADWNTVAEKTPIVAGGTLKVDYAPQRLPNCRATKYGMPAWSILMWVRWDGGDAAYVPMTAAGPMLSATIKVPETAKKLELWFYANDYYGCKEWDSAAGANYPFDVAPPAKSTAILLTGDWNESTDGPLQQAAMARIVYAPERLPACRHTVAGARAWSMYAGWRFLPGGQSGTVSLLSADPYSSEVVVPLVAIPPDATSVELWFSNSDDTGCVAWDSNYGKNYAFPVVPKGGLTVGWAGDFDFVLFGKQPEHKGDIDPVYYFDAWQGMPLSSFIEVQAWVAGVTDKPYANPEAAATAAGALTAQLQTDAVKADDGSWKPLKLKFERQQGNNFVWSFRLGDLRWPQYGYNVPDGLWHYTVRVSADGGATWTQAGPAGAQPRRLVLAKTQDCKLFPDNAPPGCANLAAVGWAGNWGGYFTHACAHKADLPDPVVFTKSAVGHDCMTLTAEVWVAGVTDKGGLPTSVLAEVETDIAYGGGPLTTPKTYKLGFDAKVGNNFRFSWNVGQFVSMADKGDYTFRFRFSADGGKSWTWLGKDGPTTPRKLWVRNDSSDLGKLAFCDDLQSWDGPSSYVPTCLAHQPDTNVGANNCEFHVNAVGRGSWSHNGFSMKWFEAWLPVAKQQGELLAVGMWVRWQDDQGATHDVFSLGKEVEPSYWKVGFTYARGGPNLVSFDKKVQVFAFFVDVKRPSGKVERLWQSDGGKNYTEAATWAKAGYVLGIGSGSIEYADASAGVFGAKKVCKP